MISPPSSVSAVSKNTNAAACQLLVRSILRGMPAKLFESGVFIDDAMRNTGLSDFGGDRFREPLEVLCESLNRDFNLNPVGEMTAESADSRVAREPATADRGSTPTSRHRGS